MEYGAEKTTKVLDDNGSTETIIENIHNKEVIRPVRKVYEIKIRVHSQQEEHKIYLEFSDDINRDKTMLDPYFKIERTKIGNDSGYYYTVKCFTLLSY